jgi:hypothetical protein
MQYVVEYHDGSFDISEPQDADFNDLKDILMYYKTSGFLSMDSVASGTILIPMTSIKKIRELK